MRKATALLSILLMATLPACRPRDKEPTIEELLANIESPDIGKAGNARLALIKLGEPVVPRLAEMLATGTPSRQKIVANLLWAMGPKVKAAVPALTAVAATAETDLRLTIFNTLEHVGPAAEPAVPVLIQGLRDRDPEIRRAAVATLAAIGPGAKDALPALRRMVQLTSWSAAEAAIQKIQRP